MVESVRKTLEEAKRHDLSLPVNVYSLSRFAFEEGILLRLNARHPWKKDEMLPPHITFGEKFITRDKTYGSGCVYHPEARGGFVRRARVRLVEPSEGKSFSVLALPEDDEKTCLLYAVFGTETGHHLNYKKSVIDQHIFHGFEGMAKPVVADVSGYALFQFTKQGQWVHVMYPDGYVARIEFKNGHLVSQKLSLDEMLTIRIGVAERQLGKLPKEDKIRRREILLGMVNLLGILKKENHAIQKKLYDFVMKQDLSEGLRGRVQDMLVMSSNLKLAFTHSGDNLSVRVRGCSAAA